MRTVLVADPTVLSDALAIRLNAVPDLQVVRISADVAFGAETAAVALAERASQGGPPPDVLLIDAGVGGEEVEGGGGHCCCGCDGIRVVGLVRYFRTTMPGVKILMLGSAGSGPVDLDPDRRGLGLGAGLDSEDDSEEEFGPGPGRGPESRRPDPGLIAAVRSGLSGWIPRDASIRYLLAAIRGVARGEIWIPPRLLKDVLDHLLHDDGLHTAASDGAASDGAASNSAVGNTATTDLATTGTAGSATAGSDTAALTTLTPREAEVLCFLVSGLDRADIAARLFISPHTVRTHIQRILNKLGAHSTVAAVAQARRAGMRPLPTLMPPANKQSGRAVSSRTPHARSRSPTRRRPS
jgi:DNA-binding NarL/FixJ family response regulator